MVSGLAERMVVRFLGEHPEWGVNALLGAMTPLGTDRQPGAVLAFYSTIDDECVAVKLAPDVTPCLVVAIDSNPQGKVERGRRQLDTPLVVNVGYFTETEETTTIRQDWLYISRAITTSLLAMCEPMIADAAPGWRQMGSVKLLKIQSVTEVPLSGSRGSLRLVGLISAEILAAHYVNF